MYSCAYEASTEVGIVHIYPKNNTIKAENETQNPETISPMMPRCCPPGAENIHVVLERLRSAQRLENRSQSRPRAFYSVKTAELTQECLECVLPGDAQ